MKLTRVTRLERLVRERPCPGCGRTHSLPGNASEASDASRLNASEQEELWTLVGVARTEQCPRCGRVGHDIDRLTDEQAHRLLTLLRVVCPGE